MIFVKVGDGKKPMKRASIEAQSFIVEKGRAGVGPHALAEQLNLTLEQVRYILKKNGLNGKSHYYVKNRP